MVICQCLSACTRAFLTRFQDDHLARFILDLAFPIMCEHALLQGIRLGLDILASLIFDYRECTEPDLRIDTNQILELLRLILGHKPSTSSGGGRLCPSRQSSFWTRHKMLCDAWPLCYQVSPCRLQQFLAWIQG